MEPFGQNELPKPNNIIPHTSDAAGDQLALPVSGTGFVLVADDCTGCLFVCCPHGLAGWLACPADGTGIRFREVHGRTGRQGADTWDVRKPIDVQGRDGDASDEGLGSFPRASDSFAGTSN